MRAFILGNSGELLDHDLTRLSGEAVFGVNALPLRCADIITHYVCADIGMAFVPEVRSLVPPTTTKYYSRILWNTIAEEDGVKMFDTYDDRMVGFSISETKVYLCRTVTYAALQIAAALGYNPIYTLGIDLGTPANGISRIPEQDKLEELIRSKNLRVPTDDKQSSPARLDHNFMATYCNHAFVIARDELSKHGIEVYNLSHGGNLKAFKRKSFNDIVQETEILK